MPKEKKKNKMIGIHISEEEKEIIIKRTKEFGLSSMSEFIRMMALKGSLTSPPLHDITTE